MKTALITGINGMDGSHLADLLLTKGYNVFGMERSGLVIAWTIHKANGVTLDEAYAKVQEKNNKVINYSNWIKRNDII